MNRFLNIRLILLLSLTVIYNFFFWRETAGVNAVIFTVLTSLAVIFLNKGSYRNKYVIIALLAVIYSGVFVLFNKSGFARLSLFASLLALTGFAHQKAVRTVLSAGLTAFTSFFLIPYNIAEGSRKGSGKYRIMRFAFRSAKIVLLPVLVVTVFYALYAYANPLFNSYSNTFWDKVGEYLGKIFRDYPFGRFMFILLGFVLIMGLLYNNNISLFRNIDLTFFDKLRRDKLNKLVFRISSVRYVPVIMRLGLINKKFTALSFEYKTGVALLILVNLLILVLNILDIRFLWFDFDARQVDNLAYYVHEGTWVLIFCILFTMAILLYLFRGNINFLKNNRLIKYLGYLWLSQNVIMAISVGLRNYYYILYYYALSYKRIGVMIFLLLVVIGLVTMMMKIAGKRTAFNIIKLNSWAVCSVLLLVSAFNWDVLIAEFNLSNPKLSGVDVRYLLSLSDDVLPLLDRNKNKLDADYMTGRYFIPDDKNGLDEFERKKDNFMIKYESFSWLSWNLPDYGTYRYFKEEENSEQKSAPVQ